MEEKKQENQFSGMTREEIILEARKQILHSAVLALAALIVIGVACYAWFVSTKTVTANVGSVSMGDMTFDLASAGSLSAFVTPDGYTVPEGDEYKISGSRWTFGNQTIQWRMTDTDNLGNYKADEKTEPEGLRPGMSGHLSFYVIPHGNGPLRVRFNLSIVPLKAVDKEDLTSPLKEIHGESAASNLLRGHLMFACPQNYSDGELMDNPGMTLVDYSNGSFTIYFGIVKEDTPIPVTLEWHWYNTLSDALKSAYGSSIFKSMKAAPNAFFYSADTELSIPDTATEDTIQADPNFNNYFDDADYYIGNCIDAIILRLDAEKAF